VPWTRAAARLVGAEAFDELEVLGPREADDVQAQRLGQLRTRARVWMRVQG
jgi:hypothetical protein